MSTFRPLAGVVEEPDNQHRYFEEAGYVPDSGGYGIAAFRGLALSPARITCLRFRQRDEGVQRSPGGPPHQCGWQRN